VASAPVVDETLLAAEVVNGSQRNLSAVGVCIIDKANGRLFAQAPGYDGSDLHR